LEAPRVVTTAEVGLPITYRGTVYPWQCDHMGHMNVMWYVGKFDEATWHVFGLLGLTPSFLREHDRGMAGVQQNTSYKCLSAKGDRLVQCVQPWGLLQRRGGERELRAGDIIAFDPGFSR